MTHVHPVQIYYEDTDHSGAVYHANYLKYFERAREHMLGPKELVRLLNDDGVGFVVYRVEVTYRKSAAFGDSLEIRSTVRKESDYRLVFSQNAHRVGEDEALCEGKVDLVTVNRQNELVVVPESVMRRLTTG
ncbi:MAG: YbgC/FadM family acyl-CoA thioesterase [Myxococcales bacterium]|nr:YbgC/FadM family acyl-CoA thioesterase [Myxococcales bacterium]